MSLQKSLIISSPNIDRQDIRHHYLIFYAILSGLMSNRNSIRLRVEKSEMLIC